MGRTPSATAPSTISTARSTPKQNPNSSASKTSITVGCPLVGLLCRRFKLPTQEARRSRPAVCTSLATLDAVYRLRQHARRSNPSPSPLRLHYWLVVISFEPPGDR